MNTGDALGRTMALGGSGFEGAPGALAGDSPPAYYTFPHLQPAATPNRFDSTCTSILECLCIELCGYRKRQFLGMLELGLQAALIVLQEALVV